LSVSETGVKRLTVEHDGTTTELRAQQVVLAMGKVGAATQTAFCRNLGIGISTRPMYLGVRFETDASVLAPLFALSKDPKYSLRLPDGSKIKTHCASENGQVLDLHYDGLPLAGGHNFRDHSTGRSGFAILWDGYQWPGEAYDAARGLMQRIAATTDGKLLAHAWSDYQNGLPSDEGTLAGLPLSQRHCAPGDVRQFLPASYFSACDEFLSRLGSLCPQLPGKRAVFYAPAIEWWMNRINTEQHMETVCRGLYSCGDGSGWSQGIVHAAATGLWASEGISSGRVSPEQLRQVLSGSQIHG